MKKILLSALLLLATVAVNAIPAQPGLWRTYKTADGKTLRVQLCGDEFMRYWQAEDGKCFTLANDELRPADMTALQKHATEMRATMYESAQANSPMRAQGVNKVAQRTSFTGSKRCVILLVQFSDVKFTMDDPQAYYDRVANEKGLSGNGFVGSVADYFNDQSNGAFNLEFDVYGPYTLGTQASYGANDSSGDDVNARGMVVQACSQAYGEGVDFSPYDWDGDGFVEEVYVIYAGRGEATGGGTETIWPHKWQLATATKFGSKYVSVYACSNELRTANSYMGIGTICHEFSHCLGYPDMYDTRGNSGESNTYYGMGTWDLMCSGSYNGNEFCPAGYTAYEKMVAGWVTPKDLYKDTSVSGLKTTAAGGDVYRFVNPGNSNEYYLIENRQRTGWDKYLAASGIIINHIDYSSYYWNMNVPNTPKYDNDHERITIIPADNVKDKTTESGDAWPYGGRTTLGNTTTPSCVAYNDNNGQKLMNITLSNMACSGGLASFSFANLNIGSDQEGYLIHETFDRSAGTGGNDDAGFTPPTSNLEARNYANASVVVDCEGWTSNRTLKGGSKCAVVGRSDTSGGTNYATSPAFTLTAGQTATIKFKAAPYGSDGTTLTLSADNGTLSDTQFTMIKDQWTDFSTTITGSGDTKLTFTANRFFLDEIEITASSSTGIENNTFSKANTTAKKGVYSISGVYLGTSAETLPSGVYIINGRKVVK